jgi:Protein of unknown function (DUF2637)
VTASPHGRTEDAVQIVILLIVGGMAGAASFTHVHDWTMHNAPAGTGSWFGWANAIISELTPTAAGIEIRRRKRQHRTAAYPTAVLIAAVTLSLSAQVAQAKPSITGWLLAAVPALAFLALTKLLFSHAPARITQPRPPIVTSPQAAPAPAADRPDEATASHLLLSARMAAFAHQQATGQPITPTALASHLNIPEALAGTLLDHLDGTPPSVTAVNGTAPGAGRP